MINVKRSFVSRGLIILVSIIVLFMVFFINQSAVSAKTLTLKVGHVLAPDHPYQTGLLYFSKLVKEKTNGEINIQVFPSSQLGNERDMIEGLQLGTLDISLVSTAPLSGFSKSFMVFDLPFIFKDRDSAYKVLDGKIGTESLNTLEKIGIKGLCYWENGFRNLTNDTRPINSPNDVKGLKIRLMENPVHMASFRALGADPTPMAFGELFTALQQGTIDGQENPLPIIWTSHFYEVQKYLAITEHFYAPAPLLISKARWNKLTSIQQDAIQKAAIEARDYERQLVKDMSDKLLEELIEKGMIVTYPDKNEFKKATRAVYEEFEDEIGKDFIKKVEEALQ